MPWLIGGVLFAGVGSYFLTQLNQSARLAFVGSGAYLTYTLLKGK